MITVQNKNQLPKHQDTTPKKPLQETKWYGRRLLIGGLIFAGLCTLACMKKFVSLRGSSDLMNMESRENALLKKFKTFPGNVDLFSPANRTSEIAIVSLAAGESYQKAVAPGLLNKQLYSSLHGHDYYLGLKSFDSSRHPTWSKISLLHNVLKNKNYSWVFWTDADSLIMNKHIKLETMVDNNYDLIITEDWNGMNAGQFFLKNNDWSLSLLERVYARKDLLNHKFSEQQAIVEESIGGRVKIVPRSTFNSYGFWIPPNYTTFDYKKGDFLIHFPGIKAELGDYMRKFARISWVKNYIDTHSKVRNKEAATI